MGIKQLQYDDNLQLNGKGIYSIIFKNELNTLKDEVNIDKEFLRSSKLVIVSTMAHFIE